MPAVPAFHAGPAGLDEIVDHLARRALALALPDAQFGEFVWVGQRVGRSAAVPALAKLNLNSS
jgi:hypothetical protein